MILVFFVILALLTWQICRELERRETQPGQLSPQVDCCGCGRQAEDDWLVCPHCSSLLQEHCSVCGERHGSRDSYCPWCGSADEGEGGR